MTKPKSRVPRAVELAAQEAVRRLVERDVDLSTLPRGDIDLGSHGSKWKHGWIPLNAVAAAIKAKKFGPGHSSSSSKPTVKVPGKARGQFKAEQGGKVVSSMPRSKSKPRVRTETRTGSMTGADAMTDNELRGATRLNREPLAAQAAAELHRRNNANTVASLKRAEATKPPNELDNFKLPNQVSNEQAAAIKQRTSIARAEANRREVATGRGPEDPPKLTAAQKAQKTSDLHDRTVGGNERKASADALRRVANRHQATAEAHRKEGNADAAQWHDDEGKRLHDLADAKSGLVSREEAQARGRAIAALSSNDKAGNGAARGETKTQRIAREERERRIAQSGTVNGRSVLKSHGNHGGRSTEAQRGPYADKIDRTNDVVERRSARIQAMSDDELRRTTVNGSTDDAAAARSELARRATDTSHPNHPNNMRVEKQDYSRGKYRVLNANGEQIYERGEFDHPNMGKIHLNGPVAFDRKRDADAWLETKREQARKKTSGS